MASSEEQPTFVHTPASDEEINRLAQALLGGSVFTSQHLKHDDPQQWAHDLNIVFLPIGLGMLSQPGMREAFCEHKYVFYNYLDQAGPRSVNGMPMFFSVKLISWEQWLKVVAKHDAAKKALEA